MQCGGVGLNRTWMGVAEKRRNREREDVGEAAGAAVAAGWGPPRADRALGAETDARRSIDRAPASGVPSDALCGQDWTRVQHDGLALAWRQSARTS